MNRVRESKVFEIEAKKKKRVSNKSPIKKAVNEKATPIKTHADMFAPR